jgi:hypothetical protein
MTPIKPGQVYRSCRPSDMGFRIRIVAVGEKSGRACEAANGRPLLSRVPVRNLHDSPITSSGRRRTAGYVLEAS